MMATGAVVRGGITSLALLLLLAGAPATQAKTAKAAKTMPATSA